MRRGSTLDVERSNARPTAAVSSCIASSKRQLSRELIPEKSDRMLAIVGRMNEA